MDLQDGLAVASDSAKTGAHSLLGASGAHRWLACPGSFALSRAAPQRPPSRYAAAGTLAHSVIEEAFRQGPRVLEKMRGAQVTADGHLIEIDEEFISGINCMLDYVVSRSRHKAARLEAERTV